MALHEEDVFVSGNGAAVRWIGDGTGTNGRKVTFEGIDAFTVGDDGKIEELRAYWDPASRRVLKKYRGSRQSLRLC